MPGEFLRTIAPNGMSWEKYCGPARPVLDSSSGLVTGPWGECVHWAVVYEKTNPGWVQMPAYRDNGPAGQVIAFLEEKGHGSFRGALERTEEASNKRFYEEANPTSIGQPTVVGMPGAPPGNAPIVVGVPLTVRAEQAISNGTMPVKTRPEQVQQGATVLDSNPAFPDHRPLRDLPFAILFLIVVIGVIVAVSVLAREIPLLVTRQATTYEAFPGMTCTSTEIATWSNGESTLVAGIRQRLEEEVEEDTVRRLRAVVDWEEEDDAARRLVADEDWEEAFETSGVPVFEVPGLSAYLRRLKKLGVPTAWIAPKAEVPPVRRLSAVVNFTAVGSWEEAAHPRELAVAGAVYASTRRRRTQETLVQVPDRDCERACSAFEECVAFQVTQESSGVVCNYLGAIDGTVPEPQISTLLCSTAANCTSCWRKVDADTVTSFATQIIQIIFGLAVVGGCISMMTACFFVRLAECQPAVATYVGVYFVPACAIVIGLVVATALFPYLATTALLIGIPLVACGACCCFCTWFCYRDLIPLTIEVIAEVTKVIMRYKSLFIISLGGAVASVLWSFACGALVISVYALQDRNKATTPANQSAAGSSYVVYAQYFLEMFVYYWGGFTAFNSCHVVYCGVFGRWYFGKEDEGGMVSKSVRTAFTSSFGSVCFGSLIIAAIRALEAVLRKLQNDAAEQGNTVVCVIACILRCIVQCIGDIVEWISTYVFVQVAIRGLGFLPAAQATYSLASVSNLIYVVSAILVEWVVFMGAVLCALSGGLVAAGLGYVTCGMEGWCVTLSILGGVCGLLAGCVSGGTAVGVINSGASTLLMCWAENREILEIKQPSLFARFQSALSRVGAPRTSARSSASGVRNIMRMSR